MASLARTYSRQKRLGQIYTPTFIVEKILNDLDFFGEDILYKDILDPACGDGRFLEEIVRRLVAVAPPDELPEVLQHVHGWDIDPEAIKECWENLDAIVAPLGLCIDWQLTCVDALQTSSDSDGSFDFIVGNPPYIRIQHLSENQRAFIQQNYRLCRSGATDIFVAFYELAWRLLSAQGRCGFITPNTLFSTQTARYLRKFLTEETGLRQITNYGSIQVFEQATTYSAIVIFDKNKKENIKVEIAQTLCDFYVKNISLSKLQGEPFWVFDTLSKPSDAQPLGQIARIHVGLTTLCDKAYFFDKIISYSDDLMQIQTTLGGNFLIEKKLLKPLVKASVLKSSKDTIWGVALFPYEKKDGRMQIIPEATLQADFSHAYRYLCQVRPYLDRRDNGRPNPVAWYAYGRSQGLETSFGKKILFSPMNQRPNFILYEEEEATFFAGYCIKYDGDYEALLTQLNSTRMADYIQAVSRDYRGGWKAYNKSVLQHFMIRK
jgi:adenine-specific DNA-methyltransferase